MDKHKAYIITLSTFFQSSILGLALLGESNMDTYMSLMTIGYLAASAIFRPRRRIPDLLGVALILTFIRVVVIRIVEIIV